MNQLTNDTKNNGPKRMIKLIIGVSLCIPLLFQSVNAQCIEGKVASKALGVDKSLKSKVKLSEFKDNYKLLYFWSSEYESNLNLFNNLRDLQSALEQSGANMKIIAINSDLPKTGSRINRFYDAKGWVAQYDDSKINFTYDKKQRASKAYCISGFPTIITLDEKDRLIGKYKGDMRARKVINNLTGTFKAKS